MAASAGWRGRRARAWAAVERRHRVAGVWTSGDGMNVAQGDFDFCGTCGLNELRVAEIPQRTPRVSSQPRLDRIGQPIPARISTHPGNGTLLGAARQDDQRISKSRFDATDIVRVAAFDRTLLQLDFGSIASSAEARARGSVARAALYRASGFVLWPIASIWEADRDYRY